MKIYKIYSNEILACACLDTSILFQITGDVINVNQLKSRVFNELLISSAIRKLNEQEDWGVTLSNIPFVNFVREGRNLEDVVEVINCKNKCNKINQSKLKEIEKMMEHLSNSNLLEVTNGHDFCDMLLHELRCLFPNSKKVKVLNSDQLSLILRMGYKKEHFMHTQLFAELDRYQNVFKLKLL